jgi:hypothetical protein
VADGDNVNHSHIVVYGVDDAIVADPNPPQESLAFQFATSGWSRLACQGVNLEDNAMLNLSVQRFQLFSSRASYLDAVFTHPALSVLGAAS